MGAVRGTDANRVGTIAAARRRGLGAASLDDVEVVGTPLEVARGRVPPFAYPPTIPSNSPIKALPAAREVAAAPLALTLALSQREGGQDVRPLVPVPLE